MAQVKKFDDVIEFFVDKLNSNVSGKLNRNFEVNFGRKYAKVMVVPGGTHCFIERNSGKIFKAASCSAPEKNFPRYLIQSEEDATAVASVAGYGYLYSDFRANIPQALI